MYYNYINQETGKWCQSNSIVRSAGEKKIRCRTRLARCVGRQFLRVSSEELASLREERRTSPIDVRERHESNEGTNEGEKKNERSFLGGGRGDAEKESNFEPDVFR